MKTTPSPRQSQNLKTLTELPVVNEDLGQLKGHSFRLVLEPNLHKMTRTAQKYHSRHDSKLSLWYGGLTIPEEKDEILCFVLIEGLEAQGILQGLLGPSIPKLGIFLLFCGRQ